MWSDVMRWIYMHTTWK
jgi:hypothetical protein